VTRQPAVLLILHAATEALLTMVLLSGTVYRLNCVLKTCLWTFSGSVCSVDVSISLTVELSTDIAHTGF